MACNHTLILSYFRRDRTNANNVPQLSSRADRNKLLKRRPAPAANDDGPVPSDSANDDGADDDDDDDDELLQYEPSPAVRSLCSSIDAFIFVVDASTPIESGKCIQSVPN